MNPSDVVETSAVMDPFVVLMSFPFWLIAVVNFAVIVAIKQSIKAMKKVHVLETFVSDLVLNFFPLIFGALLGYLTLGDEYNGTLRAMIGLTAGFLNPFAMKMLEKVAPTWVVSAYDPSRNNGINLPSKDE